MRTVHIKYFRNSVSEYGCPVAGSHVAVCMIHQQPAEFLAEDLSAVALMGCLPHCAWRLFIMASTFLPRKCMDGFHLNSSHMWINILLMALLISLQTTTWWPLFLRSFHSVCTSFVCVYCGLWRYVSPKLFVL